MYRWGEGGKSFWFRKTHFPSDEGVRQVVAAPLFLLRPPAAGCMKRAPSSSSSSLRSLGWFIGIPPWRHRVGKRRRRDLAGVSCGVPASPAQPSTHQKEERKESPRLLRLFSFLPREILKVCSSSSSSGNIFLCGEGCPGWMA